MVEILAFQAFGHTTYVAFCTECDTLVKGLRTARFGWLDRRSAVFHARKHLELQHVWYTQYQGTQGRPEPTRKVAEVP